MTDHIWLQCHHKKLASKFAEMVHSRTPHTADRHRGKYVAPIANQIGTDWHHENHEITSSTKELLGSNSALQKSLN